ncbi:hypothetical protein CONPUDRAFT_163125 [Coniophora puteana RWD-64-598 SS2]|uniref:Uncharacterized protein n=1 Tax=Coniophora puteana (strain RWD-64-598) TaxID=741705 RepID=A0A5M3MXL7_CONPW|nr:uncharacterized protein CONPUDRAFT_163125 [Coniophora puteana RWD-64-598 SS2]EIW83848.1 hypothetical protein CONPUDRAFT_163125 [Coniophora puteana RWD-64-598 SS2]
MSVTTTTIPAICEFANAVADLGRISTIRTAPCLADAVAALKHAVTTRTDTSLISMRDNLLRDSRNPVALHILVGAAEVLGIANAVATCFVNTPHHRHAQKAALRAGMLFGNAQKWFTHSSDVPAVEDGDNGYRALLLEHLDWVHQYGTFDNGSFDNTNTCLSPFTTYLQLTICSTPMEDWAEAAVPSHLSPLSLAWDWARTSPVIGTHTVDVVVLVTMGCHIQRVVADVPVKAAEEMAAIPGFCSTLVNDGLWASFGVVWGRLRKTMSSQHTATSRSDRYTPIAENDSSEALQQAAQLLRDTGEQYAQMLSEKDVASARVEDIVNRLHTWTAIIVAKAEPLAPPTILKAIPGLSKTGLRVTRPPSRSQDSTRYRSKHLLQ